VSLATSPVPSQWFTVGADAVRHLRDGVAAFPAMLDAIAAAEREVLLEMYWVSADKTGTRFRDALATRARAGVRVHVIYDAVGSLSVPEDWWAPVRDAGGEVVLFHTLSPLKKGFRWGLIEERDHRKVLVVDGRIGFTGGINLGDEWLPIDQGGKGWRDDMIAVRGPTAEELRTLFFRTRRRVRPKDTPRDLVPVPQHPIRPVWVLASRTLRRRAIHREYLRRIQLARKRIDIANSYFIPDRRVRAALFRAVARGVAVRVLVPQHGDVLVAQLAVQGMFEQLLRHGVELYAYQGPMLHAKTAIIDEAFTTIGSYNLDERSWRKNLEVNMAVEDRAFARHVRGWYESDLLSASKIELSTWRERSMIRRGFEWAAFAMRRLW
jgi:cardiolipin synthase